MTNKLNVPVIWQNSVADFETLDTKSFYSHVGNFAEEFNKEYPLKNIEIQISQLTKEENSDTKDFLIKLHLHLKNGKKFLSRAQDSHVNLALKKAIDAIHHQTQLSDRQKHNSLGRHHLVAL